MTHLINVLPTLTTFRPSPSKDRKRSRQQSSYSSSSTVPAVFKAVNSFFYLKDGLTHKEREDERLLQERKQILWARMQSAESLEQWDTAAQELDTLEGNDEWKADVSSGDYNSALLELRLRELDEARINCDLRTMLHIVRTALSRDLGGMGNIDLYRHSYRGTKRLIERYVDSALQTITALVDKSTQHLPDGLESKDLLDAMLYARQSFGRSALLLSGGGTFGMSHIGVFKALFEAKLVPRIVSGASAGSIVCSVVCTRTDDEIPDILRDFPYGDLAVFEEEGNEDGILDHLRRLLTEGKWSDIKHLARVMRNLLGDMTFQEAYNRTRRICNICVSSASIYELPRLLNYVTAPNVMIWSAVAASCSVPLVFSAAPLLVKNPLTGEQSTWNPNPQMWIDGSVDNDLPMTRLAEMFNVNHFIVSQVNPHVVPFLAKDDSLYPSTTPHRETIYREESDWMHTLTALAKDEALHRMQFMAELGIFPNLITKLRSIMSQKYSGDINILPGVGVLDLPRILRNPTTDYMLRLSLLGERATWPKLSRIRDRCAIELALDRAVHALRARVVFSKSQVDLRRMATGTLSTLRRGSHERLGPIATTAEGVAARERMRHRRRRSSGTNLPLHSHHYHYHYHHDSPPKITDDDTDEEERLEMALRHQKGKPKLKLKKLPKHHPLHHGPKTTSILSSTTDTDSFDFFDFSQPVAPPPPKPHNAGSGSQALKVVPLAPPHRPRSNNVPAAAIYSRTRFDGDDGSSHDILSSSSAAEAASMTSPHRAHSNGSDSHTSDADIDDSHTDDNNDDDTTIEIKR